MCTCPNLLITETRSTTRHFMSLLTCFLTIFVLRERPPSMKIGFWQVILRRPLSSYQQHDVSKPSNLSTMIHQSIFTDMFDRSRQVLQTSQPMKGPSATSYSAARHSCLLLPTIARWFTSHYDMKLQLNDHISMSAIRSNSITYIKPIRTSTW